MFIITIPEWKFNNTMVQTATRWEYFQDEECTKLIKKFETKDKETFMLVDKLSYPADTIFYVRPTRIFPKKEIQLRPTVVRTKDRSLKNLPVYRDGASIVKPVLKYDKEGLNNDNIPSFNIESSIFQGTQCKHLLTNWVIQDLNGKVLETNLNNKIDLTKISVRKVLLERNRGLRIKCQHVGDNLEASSFGELILEIRGGELFNILREYEDVNPNKDLFIPITAIDNVDLNNIIKSAVFKRLNDREDLEGEYITIEVDVKECIKNKGFTLKQDYMSPGSMFILEIYSQDLESNIISTKVKIDVRPALPTMDYTVKDQVELVALEDIPMFMNKPVSVSDFYFTEYDYGLLRSGGDRSPFLFKGSITNGGNLIDPDKHEYLEKTVKLYETEMKDMRLQSSTGCDGALIYNGSDYAIVDSPKASGVPVLKIYKQDPVKEEFKLFGPTYERNDEQAPIGKTGAFYVDREKETLYYAPIGVSELRRLSLLTQKLESVQLDARVKDGCFIHNPRFKKTMWFGLDGYAYIQDGWNGKLEQSVNLPFDAEVREFKFVLMNNHDTLIIGFNPRSEIVSIHRYECVSSKFIELEIDVIKSRSNLQFKGIVKGYRKEVYIQCFDGKKYYWFRYV